MLSAIDVIVVVLIVAAAALAFIVLYDLTTIDIGERIREIATLKVLGFRRGEVDAYVFREVAVLVLVGALAGLGLGTWLEGFVVAGGIAAVVDGVTSKSTAGIWEPSGGVVARRALCAALERLGSDEPPCDPADMRAVQRVLDGELRARYEHDRAAAAAGGIAYFRTHRPAPAPRARRHQGLRSAARHLRRPHLPALSRALSVVPWARAPGAGRRRQCHRAMRD